MPTGAPRTHPPRRGASCVVVLRTSQPYSACNRTSSSAASPAHPQHAEGGVCSSLLSVTSATAPSPASVRHAILPTQSWSRPGQIGFVERPDMYRMCRRCTEDVQKVYRRCTEGMYRRFCRRLKEKKAACALTGWLYGPRHAQTQGTGSKDSLSVWLAGAVTSTLSCLCSGRTVPRGHGCTCAHSAEKAC